MAQYTIYHYPKCGTSRKVVERLQATGHQVTIIEYIKQGWNKEQLKDMFAKAGISVQEALRVKGTNAETLGLLQPDIKDDTILDAMVKDPILVNRPFVVGDKGAIFCRPAEKLDEFLS